MKKIIPGLCLMLLATISFSQKDQPDNYCGYHEKSEWLTEYQKNPEAYPQRKSGAITYVPMTVHVVGDDNGNGYFGETPLLDALCTLNEDFLDSEIQFYLARDFNYLDNSDWYEHDFTNGRRMMNSNNFNNSINSYFCENVADNCGYFSPGPDALAVAKMCAGARDHTWSHEVGHFLSLPHPFVGWEGRDYRDFSPTPRTVGGGQVELVDGTNCLNAADGFCDTPPDYISSRWSCNGSGQSQVLTDPNGEEFRADGSLFMSYANDACSNRFSDDQIDAMHANITFERRELLTNPTPMEPIDWEGGLEALSPTNGGSVPAGEVTLTWKPVKNATRYVVEVFGLPTFNPLLYREIVSTNEAVIPNMTRERPHFWRVRPYNEFHFCEGFSDLRSFVVTAASSANYLTDIDVFSINPMPAESGSQFTIELSSENAFEAKAKLINLTGQVLSENAYQISAGAQQFQFDLPNVPEGIYLFSLENEDGERMVRKVVIN